MIKNQNSTLKKPPEHPKAPELQLHNALIYKEKYKTAKLYVNNSGYEKASYIDLLEF